MESMMKKILSLVVVACWLVGVAQSSADVSFDLAVPPVGWQVTGGAVGGEGGIGPADKVPLSMHTERVLALPAEVTFRVRLAEGRWAYLNVLAGSDKEPALAVSLMRRAGNSLQIGARASGKPMATLTISSRPYSKPFNATGAATYQWRYAKVKNLWDDRDRMEIGSDYEALTPFDQKRFVVRLVVTATSRQVWLDDRLIAEARVETQGPIGLATVLHAGDSIASVEVAEAQVPGRFLSLRLTDYRSDGSPQGTGELVGVPAGRGDEVPVRIPAAGVVDFDLGNSLFRYRLTEGSGPDAPYVNGTRAYPNPLVVDPAVFALRVPYRAYRHVWLTVWVDDDEHSVAAGAVRFYRDRAGYCASTAFEISEAAIRRGTVRKLDRATADGKPLYLVRVPVDTDGLSGFADMRSQFLDLQITKPLYLLRSYPDPIYYGYHPGGRPSSVHVVGVTLEDASFDYTVTPAQYGGVFERPEVPSYTVQVSNSTGERLSAKVRLDTMSYDGSERTVAKGQVRAAANAAGETKIELGRLRRFGWHELRVTVEANGETRTNTVSLILLPPDRRTYGNADNETRFGSWMLLGHYTPFTTIKERNEPILAMMRRLGIRRCPNHGGFFTREMLKKYDYLPGGPHTIMGYYHRLDVEDPKQMADFVTAERQQLLNAGLDGKRGPDTYFYGGEWNYDHIYSYSIDPRYAGGKPHEFGEAAMKNMKRQMTMFRAVGRLCREEFPETRLILQWGSPMNTIGFLRNGFEQEFIDGYGMDAPMFELTPEVPWVTGCINQLWQVRKEIERLGRPQRPISWCEGPFLPTNPGALTERQQEQNHVRYWLMGLAYGLEDFQAGVVPSDAGNYYGAEHYGAGVFRRVPLECPKPAAAALATAATMLCGADVIGPVDTGVLTSYCMAFRYASTGQRVHALWRVIGTCRASLEVTGAGPAVVTDAMGNATEVAVVDGRVAVTLSASPVWLSGVGRIRDFRFDAPVYASKPAAVTEVLAPFTAENWSYDGSADPAYASNHFAMLRVTDPALTATFGGGASGTAAAVTLPVQPAGERVLPPRYGAMVPTEPVLIPGKASALGVWMDGNSGWGRVVYQVRDAQGELWTSIGTRDDWNCDDTFAWSYAKFEGRRYVRFPLPASRPWDACHELEMTWWNHAGGDGIVDLPLSLVKIFVEARNEVQYLGEMKVVPDRTMGLEGLVAEYESEADKSDDVLALYALRMPAREWQGPADNPIARMQAANEAPAPVITAFEEPLHFNDGRRMVLRFTEQEGLRYALYLSRFADGRGADRLPGFYKDKQLVRGFRPGVSMYLFLTAVDAKNQESKPSPAYELVTVDKFREK